MKYLVLLLLLVVHQLCAVEIEELKSRLHKVIDVGRSNLIKSHSEQISSDSFINEHVVTRQPLKLANNAEKLTSLFDSWSEKVFTPDPVYALLMGSLTWKYKDNNPRVEFDTNFRKYLFQKEDYDVETTATFGVPYPIREQVRLPSALDCKSLTDKFTELRFDFYQNFGNFSYLIKQKEDQLICLLKGNSSFMILDDETYQKVESTQAGAPKEDYASVEYSLSTLETGDCLFVPSDQYYGVKTTDLWLLSISWHHMSEKIEKNDCQSSSPRNKLSEFIYRNDVNQKFLDLGVSSVPNLRSFISLISNDEEGLKKKEFTQQVIKKLLNFEKEDKCKGACRDTISEIYKALNINEDKLLSLEDLDYLGVERSEELEKLVGEKFTKLKSSLKKPINLALGLDDIFKHIKQTAAKLEITNEIDKVLETVVDKFNDFKSNLDEEKKKMIENFDLAKFLNTLLNQLNKISNIDGLLDTLKGLNLAPVLAHANVKKVIKDLLKRFDTEKDTFLNTLNFNSTLGFLLSQENLKGWNLNDLFGDSNMNRIVSLMATFIDVNSFVDRLITGVGLLNMFGQMNLESTLNSINSDMLLEQVSRMNSFANLNVGGADSRRAERAKHKEKLNNKKPAKKEESIFDDAQATSGSSSSSEQEIEEINAYDDDSVKPETVSTPRKDQNIVKEDL